MVQLSFSLDLAHISQYGGLAIYACFLLIVN